MSPRLTIYACEVYFLICQFFLAGKDASSYLLKDAKIGPLTLIRISRWHRDGLIMAFLYLVPCLYIGHLEDGWISSLWIGLGAVFIRLTVYDIAFNKWASLPTTYLGTTSKFDGFFSKIYGVHGAIWKAFTFLILLITLQIFIQW